MESKQIDSQQKRQRPQTPESISGKKPKKARKTEQTNPFEELLALQNQQEQNFNKNSENGWIKTKKTPLTIEISDYSKINKFFSHKSLQKYIRYLYAQTCPNPMWLSIKRQSQIKKIIYIDVECENSILHKHLSREHQDSSFQFLRQFVCPQRKAIFRQAPYLKNSEDLWEAMFTYDQLAIKQDTLNNQEINLKNLPKELSPELYSLYLTYLLTQEQRKNHLYPMKNLPVYKGYLQIQKEEEPCQEQNINNKILIIDCQMVTTNNGFELARTSIMNFRGQLIYDEFFKPQAAIINYNTQYSGITEQILSTVTKNIEDLHRDLKKLVKSSTILVGHSLQNDLHAMKFMHHHVIDTSVLFARKNGAKMKLKTLSQQILHRNIQIGSHCSQEDCRATLQIMRFKIEVLGSAMKKQNIRYHLLDDMLRAEKKILIVDSDIEWISHKTQYSEIKLCMTPNTAPKSVIRPLKTLTAQEVEQSKIDIAFTRIRRDEKKEWEEYYKELDEQLRQLYNQIPVQTVVLLNCQINPLELVYPQDSSTINERKRTFCIILVKATS